MAQFPDRTQFFKQMKKQKANILIVDDNKSVLNSLEFLLQFEYEKIITIPNPNLIPENIRKHSIDLVLLDMNFSPGANNGNEGLFWLSELQKIDSSIEVVLITAYADIELAVKGIKHGATDFIVKPWENQKILSTINACLKLRKSNKELKKIKSREKIISDDSNKDYIHIIGESEPMKKVLALVQKVAKTDANVLITGENGTGKELIAYEIHRQSDRSSQPLIKTDMGAIPESLFESELFGHVKGAFTDAKESRTGRFEASSGGTLFMDEITNIPFSLQAKLLAVLQNREVARIGSNDVIPIDLRLICATNKYIEDLVDEGLFREDLLYRINTIKITIPPLRERGDDIILLAEYFLKKYARKYHKPNLKIKQSVFSKLKEYAWPGNIRELDHSIEKAVILSDHDVLTQDDFLISITQKEKSYTQKLLTLEDTEKIRIEEAIANNHGNLNKAASELNIARQTLYRKIKKFGL